MDAIDEELVRALKTISKARPKALEDYRDEPCFRSACKILKAAARKPAHVDSLIRSIRSALPTIKEFTSKAPAEAIGKSSRIQEDHRFNDVGVVTGKGATNDMRFRAHWACRSIALEHEAWNQKQGLKSRVESFVADPSHNRKGTVAKFISYFEYPKLAKYAINHGIKILVAERFYGSTGISAQLPFSIAQFDALRHDEIPKLLEALQSSEYGEDMHEGEKNENQNKEQRQLLSIAEQNPIFVERYYWRLNQKTRVCEDSATGTLKRNGQRDEPVLQNTGNAKDDCTSIKRRRIDKDTSLAPQTCFPSRTSPPIESLSDGGGGTSSQQSGVSTTSISSSQTENCRWESLVAVAVNSQGHDLAYHTPGGQQVTLAVQTGPNTRRIAQRGDTTLYDQLGNSSWPEPSRSQEAVGDTQSFPRHKELRPMSAALEVNYECIDPYNNDLIPPTDSIQPKFPQPGNKWCGRGFQVCDIGALPWDHDELGNSGLPWDHDELGNTGLPWDHDVLGNTGVENFEPPQLQLPAQWAGRTY